MSKKFKIKRLFASWYSGMDHLEIDYEFDNFREFMELEFIKENWAWEGFRRFSVGHDCGDGRVELMAETLIGGFYVVGRMSEEFSYAFPKFDVNEIAKVILDDWKPS